MSCAVHLPSHQATQLVTPPSCGCTRPLGVFSLLQFLVYLFCSLSNCSLQNFCCTEGLVSRRKEGMRKVKATTWQPVEMAERGFLERGIVIVQVELVWWPWKPYFLKRWRALRCWGRSPWVRIFCLDSSSKISDTRCSPSASTIRQHTQMETLPFLSVVLVLKAG